MYLFYFLICYVTTLIVTVKSYVLLAANLDDFKTIAKKIVPENMADELVQIAAESGFKNLGENFNRNPQERPEYSDSQPNLEQSYEITTRPYNKPVFQHKILRQQNPPQEYSRHKLDRKTASEHSINLDEIVEKVKQRLEQDLFKQTKNQQYYQKQQSKQQQNQQLQNQQLQSQQLQIQQLQNLQQQLMPAAMLKRNVHITGVNPAQLPQALIYDNTVAPVVITTPAYEDTSYEEVEIKPKVHVQYQGPIIQNQGQMKTKRIVTNPSNNRNKLQGRYIVVEKKNAHPAPVVNLKNARHQHVAAPAPPKIVRQQQAEAQNLPQQKSHQLQKHNIKPKLNSNKKKRKTTQQEAQTQKTKAEDQGEIFEAVDMLKSNDSYEDYAIPPKEEALMSEEVIETVTDAPVGKTTKNKLKKKAPDVPVLLDEAQIIEHNINGATTEGDLDYDYETTGTPADIKARTENLSYEEKEINATTATEEVGIGKKGTKKSMVATMIPTREFYKISSPNYYGKLPIIAEKYNFNEPIPEQDREPENLKPIGNPPASINKKVKLS